MKTNILQPKVTKPCILINSHIFEILFKLIFKYIINSTYHLIRVSSSVKAIHFTALFDKSFLDKYLKIVRVFKQCPLSVFDTFNTVVGIVSSRKKNC